MNRRNILSILLLSAVTLTPVMAQAPCDIAWDPPVRISADSSVSTLPELSVAGDTIHLLWFGLDTTALASLSHSGLQYARSTDGGTTFSPPVRLLSPFESFPGHIASEGERVYIASAAVLDTFFGIALFSSTDGGATWPDTARVLQSAYPELIFASGNGLYIGYRDIETASFGVLRSSDGGVSWESPPRHSRELADVAVSGPLFHAVGPAPGSSQTEVGYYISPDSARTWYGPDIISPEDLVRSSYPRISVNDRGDLYSAWIDSGAVLFRFSRNSGTSWGQWELLDGGPGIVTTDLGADREFVMVVWDRDIGGQRGIRGRMSNDFGETFCPVMFPAGGDTAREPSIIVRDSTVHLVWIDETGGREGVFFRKGVLPSNPSAYGRAPAAFALRQSYPNPTNGYAFIAFDIPVECEATIGVYNVLGELVREVGPGTYDPGRYTVELDVGSLASGAYFYRLTAPGFDAVGKMLILR